MTTARYSSVTVCASESSLGIVSCIVIIAPPPDFDRHGVRPVKTALLVRSIRTAGVAGLLFFAGCTSAPVDQIELMPAPDVYGDGLLNPLPESNPFERIPYDGILFATDRAPAEEDDS